MKVSNILISTNLTSVEIGGYFVHQKPILVTNIDATSGGVGGVGQLSLVINAEPFALR